ncbi:hypothetical protein NIES2135_21350 [Leptolyngbya boryana NIES-2135]|jgi:hypothetical protein|uniref:Uncharacterized protein n=1 Tax=Leptolyngbya boryana NIES-2135 TaxID=1973484 RepID=A0A1Z4JEX0_LEPBY|nr:MULTISPECIES: hypothetical protein [Leptolyngbya]BAY55312.1 hypothetical protein NIES2135_21350 [Leptolyngbya boryana NIES-2135]MBD2369394.1 hypothetical protein [Leptolyngbya sp. FACHB-161]MBD2375604.1 hypothetical protein [Leptolyngbya sp. FACHB-238]MBD2401723.1 hypothetical protein [Leptolyngbya sp. FACHB-239]MBD2406538.1 hypothetical protein [Leptolyngbya sp. FACHB-402]
MTPEFPRLLIECPSDLYEVGGRECDWETFNSVPCLKLLVSPGEYTPVINYPNSEPGYVRSLSSPQYSRRAYKGGFELKVSDERDFLFYTMQSICTRSSTTQFKRETRVFDFVLPEVEDRTIGYSLRVGAFQPPKAQGGRILLESEGWIKDGFSIAFEEKRLRIR